MMVTKTMMRLAILFALLMMSMSSMAKTHDLEGKVIDMNGEPMPFVNVVLLSMPDSAFVQGAMTDEQGMFKIVTDVNDGLFKVSSIGYQTLYIKAANGLTIQMKEDAKVLSEVVVKGQLPKTHVKGDAMRTTVTGTILEKAGTVSDALSKIPSVEAERDGAVKVLGRGDAEVYINGRKVQDNSELSRLRSDQIQHVDVVQNPGARYAASTKAVVRITLKKAQGEGFSFQDNFGGIYQYGHTLTNNLDVNYRTGGLDITASLWAGRYGHWKSLQENDLTYYVGPDFYLGRSNQERKSVWKGWSPQLQVLERHERTTASAPSISTTAIQVAIPTDSSIPTTTSTASTASARRATSAATTTSASTSLMPITTARWAIWASTGTWTASSTRPLRITTRKK